MAGRSAKWYSHSGQLTFFFYKVTYTHAMTQQLPSEVFTQEKRNLLFMGISI